MQSARAGAGAREYPPADTLAPDARPSAPVRETPRMRRDAAVSAAAVREAPLPNGLAAAIARNWPLWVAGAALLYLMRSVLAPFIFAVVAAYVLVWPIRGMAARTCLPVTAVVMLLYLSAVGSLIVAGMLFGPRLARETADLATNAPAIIESLFVQTSGHDQVNILGAPVSAAEIATQLQQQVMASLGHPGEALVAAERLLTIFIEALVFLVALFYLLVDGPRISEYLLARFVAQRHHAAVHRVNVHLRTALGRYVRGQAFLVVLMAAVSYIGLSAGFGVQSALPIAIATGFMEVVPIIGPTFATILAASVGLFQGGFDTAAGIVVMYIVLRQIEDQLVMPVIIGRAVHLHPLATILAVVSGGALGGVPGMLIGVPVAAAGKILLDELAPAHWGEPETVREGPRA